MGEGPKIVTREELAQLTREARGNRSQNEVAEQFEVSQAAISRAETDEKASLDDLRRKIIQRYLGLKVEGPIPCFRLIDES